MSGTSTTQLNIKYLLILATCIIISTTFLAYLMQDKQMNSESSIDSMLKLHNYVPQLMQSHIKCEEQSKVVGHVHATAQGEAYMYPFEFARLHPCCMISDAPVASLSAAMSDAEGFGMDTFGKAVNVGVSSAKPSHIVLPRPQDSESVDVATVSDFTSSASLNDIVFVLISAPGREDHVVSSLSTWAQGTPNVVVIEDDTLSHASTVSWSFSTGADDRGSVYGLGLLQSLPALKSLSSKPWVFVVADDTWVNIPVLLQTLSRYKHTCPVALSHVRSGEWVEAGDYATISSGMALTRSALDLIAPKLLKSECPFTLSAAVTVSRCLWGSQIPLLHEDSLLAHKVDVSLDKHKSLRIPPIVTASSSPHASIEAKSLMTSFSYTRWRYQPPVDTRTHIHTVLISTRYGNRITYEVSSRNIVFPSVWSTKSSADSSMTSVDPADIDIVLDDSMLPSTVAEKLAQHPLSPTVMLPFHRQPEGILRANAKKGYDSMKMRFPPDVAKERRLLKKLASQK